MLKNFVNIVLSSDYSIVSGTLYCNNVLVKDTSIHDCISYLETKNALENDDYDNKINEIINLEFSLAHLNSIGFYESCEKFVLKNKYGRPDETYYILELKSFSTEHLAFFKNFNSIIDFINSIKNISKHTYTDVDEEKAIIFSEDRALILPFLFTASSVINLNEHAVEKIEFLSNAYKEKNSEKRMLFVNELIDYLLLINENDRFEKLILDTSLLYEKSENAFQFYLRDFSYNKLKIELDSKALEYSQKIQGVINDSQTKLIAIPTAFVLVFAAFDFSEPFQIKNIIAILSLLIFSLLLQLFLNNQKSSLRFIWDNVLSYKATFIKNDVEKISGKFSLVEIELNKQKSRLYFIEVLLWFLPISLLSVWLFLINFNLLSIITFCLFVIVMIFLKFQVSHSLPSEFIK